MSYAENQEVARKMESWGWKVTQDKYYGTTLTKRYAVLITAMAGAGDVLLTVSRPTQVDLKAWFDLGDKAERRIPYEDLTRESLDAAARELVEVYKSHRTKKEKPISNERLDAAVYNLVSWEPGRQLGWLYDDHFDFVEPYHHDDISKQDVGAALRRLQRKGLVYNHDPGGSLAYWGPDTRARLWSTYAQLKAEHGYNAEEMPPPKVPIPKAPKGWDPSWLEIYGEVVPERFMNPDTPALKRKLLR